MARFRDRMDRDSPDWEVAAVTGRINLYYFTGTIQDGLLYIPRDGDAVFWVRRSLEKATAESAFPDIRGMTSYRDAAAVTGRIKKPLYLELDAVTLAQYGRMQKHFAFPSALPLDAQVAAVRAKKSPYEFALMFNHATFGDNDILLTSGTYDTSSNVGPLQTRTYVFNVMTNASDGTYYPTFSLDFRDANSLYYRTPVKVDNTPLMLSVVDQPDAYTQGKKETITVQVANPRQNAVKNVVLKVAGNGTTITPSEQYIGWLPANSAKNVTFDVTPNTETVLDLALNYDNGDNHHSVSQTLPITFGTDKKQATPRVSNIEVTLTGGVYHVTGDVTNAGLTTANGVTVTALSPAVPQDPYRSYVIGALKPDDFGSFEVTFTAANETASVPIEVSFKDSDGNVITTDQDVGILGVVPEDANRQDSPVLPIIIVLVVIAAGGYYYYTKKIRKQ